MSPAYLGVGYIIGLRLASIQFAGGVLAWGLMVPLLIFFLGPQIKHYLPADTPDNWADMAIAVWRFIVRPIAVGGMLVGAAYTLFKMRKEPHCRHWPGIVGSAPDRRSAGQAFSHRTIHEFESGFRLDRADVRAHVLAVHPYFRPGLAGGVGGSGDAGGRILHGHSFGKSGRIHWFFQQSDFWADAFDLADCGASDGFARRLGKSGVATVLGVAAVVCVSSSVAGELLQDFKVGYILGGTPRKIQMAELIAVVVASLAMYWPLYCCMST